MNAAGTRHQPTNVEMPSRPQFTHLATEKHMALNDSIQAAQLRHAHYNAELIDLKLLHDDLAILRIRPDTPLPTFLAGQYSVLGLGHWEPRVAGCQTELLDDSKQTTLVKRAYSLSCPMLDEAGQLCRVTDCDFLEIYVALVRFAHPDHAPALTPRLFALHAGDRLYVGEKFTGHYTLSSVRPTDNVVFIATGTGEAPHNAMLAELLAQEHQGHIASITCVRHKFDLGYLVKHRELERRYNTYRYIPLTTREPENLHSELPSYVGKIYVQQLVESGGLEAALCSTLDPTNTHVFLCGNPAMIGLPHHNSQGQPLYPRPKGMVEVLEELGFTTDTPKQPGNIHFEKYW